MNDKVLLPGAIIGILGSGQLGRMLAIAARRMGYRTHVFSPEAASPAEAVADFATVAAYTDLAALQRFGESVDVVTFEFENIPFDCATALESWTCVRPAPRVLHIAQHRAREKEFLKQNSFPLGEFEVVRSLAEAQTALTRLGLPAVLKTAGFGYDGKGQKKILAPSDLSTALGSSPAEWVLEKWQDFEKEVSVLVARNSAGEMRDWGVVENAHRNHILDVSSVPAAVSADVAKQAVQVAHAIAKRLDLVGLLCVEFFVGRDGVVRVNEMAPRPHNSGHWTLEGSITSQFEQQLRAILGLALGSTEILRPTAMANVLGDIWSVGEPDWAAALNDPQVKWHSYGKVDARAGRKMGHLTALAETREQAVARVQKVRAALARSSV